VLAFSPSHREPHHSLELWSATPTVIDQSTVDFHVAKDSKRSIDVSDQARITDGDFDSFIAKCAHGVGAKSAITLFVQDSGGTNSALPVELSFNRSLTSDNARGSRFARCVIVTLGECDT
jgi:transcription antitermination factor NusG